MPAFLLLEMRGHTEGELLPCDKNVQEPRLDRDVPCDARKAKYLCQLLANKFDFCCLTCAFIFAHGNNLQYFQKQTC
jgi:hypothetical protein